MVTRRAAAEVDPLEASLAPDASESAETAAYQLVSAMESFGIKYAFGVPGGAIARIFDELCRSSIEVVLTQHECAAAYAAMGRALASNCRELSVCFATSGPGITNLVTGVAAAYAETVPLLVLTGNSSILARYRGALQDSHAGGIDVMRMFESITVANRMVERAADLVPLFHRVAAIGLRARKPVHLNIPVNIADCLLESGKGRDVWASRGALSDADRELLVRFLDAERPVIFAGNGTKLSGCGAELAEVANLHHVPVIVSTHGRGSVAEDDPCFFGSFGFASNGIAQEFLERHRPNAILFLGTGLGEMATAGWSALLSAAELRIHVDLDPSKFNRAYRMSGVIEHDIHAVLDALLACPPAVRQFPAYPRRSMVVPRMAERSRRSEVHPVSLFEGLSERLPDDAAVFAEAGNSMAWAFHELRLTGRRQLFVPLGLASMGSALGASIGAATKWRDRCVVCLCGDGAALMQGAELKTAVEYGIPVKFVILNDSGFGMVHHGNRLIGLTSGRVRYRHRVDFAGMGRSLGLYTATIQDEGQWQSDALERTLAHPGPALLDVWLDPDAQPPILDRARVLLPELAQSG